MIPTIGIAISFSIMLVYSIHSINDHFRKINQQAYLMAKAREEKNIKNDRWIPYSQMTEEELDDDLEEQDGVFFVEN